MALCNQYFHDALMTNVSEANKLLDVVKFYLGDRLIYPVVNKNGVIISHAYIHWDLTVGE